MRYLFYGYPFESSPESSPGQGGRRQSSKRGSRVGLPKDGQGALLRIIGVFHTSEGQCSLLLDHEQGKRQAVTGLRPTDTGQLQLDIEVDGACDISKDLKDEETMKKLVSTICRRLEDRHNNTVIVHGLPRSGKTHLIRNLILSVLRESKENFDLCARVAQEQAERAQLQQQQQMWQQQQQKQQQQQQSEQAQQESSSRSNSRGEHRVSVPHVPQPPPKKEATHSSPRNTNRSKSVTASAILSNSTSQPPLRGRSRSLHEDLAIIKSKPLPAPPPQPEHRPSPPPHRGSRATIVDPGPRKDSVAQPPTHQLDGMRKSSKCTADLMRTQSELVINPSQARRASAAPPPTGRHGASSALVFNGEDATARLPPIRDLDACADRFMAEMYIKTSVVDRKMTVVDIQDTHGECRFSIHLNANSYDEVSAGVVRMSLRDSLHRFVEAHVVCEHMFDGKWHLLQVHVAKARENKVDIRVDGLRLRLFTNAQSDEPTLFTHWEQHGHLGAEVGKAAESGAVEFPFEGSICELRFWDMSWTPWRQLARFPCAEGRGDEFRDALGGPPGTVHTAEWGDSIFPATALRLQGCNAINVGNLGTFGSSLNCFSIDVWVRTKERSVPMAIVKVTDSQRKHMCVGMTLNAGTAGVHTPDSLLLELRDSQGLELKVVYTPQKMGKELTDGAWHNIMWRVTESSANATFLKIDGVLVDVVHQCRQGPSHFLPLTDFVAIGGHNNRGKIEQCFDGMIRHVVISASGDVVGTWALDEGPGAPLAIDSGDPFKFLDDNGGVTQAADIPGGHHHGVHVTLHAKGSPPPHKPWTEWLICDLPKISSIDTILRRGSGVEAKMRWKNNIIKATCISVEPVHRSDSNTCVERLRDVRRDQQVELLPPEPSKYQHFVRRYGTDFEFERLPEEVWVECKSGNDLESFFEETIRLVEVLNECPGHRLWIFLLGDAVLSFVDLSGLHQPSSATYDARTMKWFAAAATFGFENRMSACLNRGMSAVETLLLETGTFPALWLRHPQGGAPRTTKWNESLVTRLMKAYGMVEAENWSHCYLLHTTAPGCRFTKVEVEYTQAILSGIGKASDSLATAVLLNLIRTTRARESGRLLRKQIMAASERRRQSTLLLTEHPEAAQKEQRVAILICASHPADTRIPPCEEAAASMEKIAEVLARLKFSPIIKLVSRDPNPSQTPTVAAITRALQDIDKNALVFVWVGGRGGGPGGYHRPTPLSKQCAWVIEDEAAARISIEQQAAIQHASIVSSEDATRSSLKRRTQKRGSKTKSEIHDDLNQSRKPRLIAGSGGAGKQAQKDHYDLDSTMGTSGSHIAFINSRTEVGGDEMEKRRALQDEETAARRLISHQLDELLHSVRKHPMKAKWHLIAHDTPEETTPDNTIDLAKLRELVLGEPTVGIHRFLVVDTYGWKGYGGWFFAGSSSGEYVKGSYAVVCHGLVSAFLQRGLQGAALPPKEDVVLQEERSVIDGAALVNYLSRRIKKRDGVTMDEHKATGKLVGDLVICPRVLVAPEQRRVEKKRASAANLEKEYWWLVFSLNMDCDTKSAVFTEMLRSAISQAAGVDPEGELEAAIIPCPYFDLDLQCDTSDLSRPGLLDRLRAEVALSCSPHKVITTLRSCSLPRPEETTAAAEAMHQWRVPLSCTLRVTLEGYQGLNMAEEVQPALVRGESQRIDNFILQTRRLAQEERFAFIPFPTTYRQYLLVRGRSHVHSTFALVKRARAGEFFNMLRYPCVAAGSLAAHEAHTLNRKISAASEESRQVAFEERRKQEIEEKREREKSRVLKMEEETRERILGKLEKLRSTDRNLTAPSELQLIFSLQDGELIASACNTILLHTALPFPTPGFPGPTPATPTPRGTRFMRQIIDWKLWDTLLVLLQHGTGGNGKDNTAASAAVMKLICATASTCPQPLSTHPLQEECVRAIRRHATDPGVVRWGVGALLECYESYEGIASGDIKDGKKPPRPLVDGRQILPLALYCFELVAGKKDAFVLAALLRAISSCLKHMAKEAAGEVPEIVALASYALVWSGQAEDDEDPCGKTCVVNEESSAMRRIATDGGLRQGTEAKEESASQAACYIAFEVLKQCLAIDPVGTAAVLSKGLRSSNSPFDVVVKEEPLRGPGVLVCNFCARRFTRDMNGEDGCCPESRIPTKRHSGERVEGNGEPVDEICNTPRSTKKLAEGAGDIGLMDVTVAGLIAASKGVHAVAAGTEFFINVTEPDLATSECRLKLTKSPQLVEVLLDTLLSKESQKLDGTVDHRLLAAGLKLLVCVIAESQDDIRNTPFGKVLQSHSTSLLGILPDMRILDLDLNKVGVLRHFLSKGS